MPLAQHRRDRLHHADADGTGQCGLVFNRSCAARQRRRIVLGGGAGGCHGLWCHRVSGAAGADATDRHGLLCVWLVAGTDPDWRGYGVRMELIESAAKVACAVHNRP